ncbi:hypothetical protein P3H15_45270 [Rhodococcus sp. T2V]|nr:hypothetical protein [Rhodococcus sp. T2V]
MSTRISLHAGVLVPVVDDLVRQPVHRQLVGDSDLGGGIAGREERPYLLVP